MRLVARCWLLTLLSLGGHYVGKLVYYIAGGVDQLRARAFLKLAQTLPRT